MSDNWYRNEVWNSEIEREFFSKLSRARSQRDQYIVIQALSLAKVEPKVALTLIDLYFSSKKTDFDDLRALMAKVDALAALGDRKGAVEAKKAILNLEKKKKSQRSNEFVDYPFYVAMESISEEYTAVIALLDERFGELAFPVQIFKWHAAKGLILHEMGNLEVAKEHAKFALDAAQIKRSFFRFHQNLGLVGNEYKDVVKRLRKICS